MIKILKGDTSADISFALAEGFDYSGATVHVEYQGAVKTFTGCAAGDVLALRFSADETAVMSLGSYPVVVRITNPSGMVKTIQNATTKICVTDDPSEVSGGVIALDVKGMLYGIEDLPERWTEADIVAKLREIMRRGGAVLCALLTFSAFGASVQTARKDAIWNDAQIVTNVTFDGLATTNDVSSAVVSATNDPTIVRGERLADAPDVWNIGVFSAVKADRVDEAAYAGSANFANYVAWWGVMATPTTLAGYGVAEDATNVVYGIVTNVARDVSNSFWDEENQVLWRMEFRGGEPMFVPVTNENVKASGGVL